ncbi:hypothetical protein SH139x_004359 [Planctomycetaceae bacterium SH139]
MDAKKRSQTWTEQVQLARRERQQFIASIRRGRIDLSRQVQVLRRSWQDQNARRARLLRQDLSTFRRQQSSSLKGLMNRQRRERLQNSRSLASSRTAKLADIRRSVAQLCCSSLANLRNSSKALEHAHRRQLNELFARSRQSRRWRGARAAAVSKFAGNKPHATPPATPATSLTTPAAAPMMRPPATFSFSAPSVPRSLPTPPASLSSESGSVVSNV